MNIYYLGLQEILQIHADIIEDSGGGSGIRDDAGIHSAIAAPQANYFGHERYPTFAEKAAAMCFELVTQHPFVDGNKRVGHAAMAHFLHMNGHILDAKDEEQESVMMKLAAGELNQTDFFDWVKKVTSLDPTFTELEL
jgi:death-on-curing protein